MIIKIYSSEVIKEDTYMGSYAQMTMRILKRKGAPITGQFWLKMEEGYEIKRIDDKYGDMYFHFRKVKKS